MMQSNPAVKLLKINFNIITFNLQPLQILLCMFMGLSRFYLFTMEMEHVLYCYTKLTHIGCLETSSHITMSGNLYKKLPTNSFNVNLYHTLLFEKLMLQTMVNII